MTNIDFGVAEICWVFGGGPMGEFVGLHGSWLMCREECVFKFLCYFFNDHLRPILGTEGFEPDEKPSIYQIDPRYMLYEYAFELPSLHLIVTLSP